MEKATTRFEAFSDGVFAFAITLLVLDLKIGLPRSATASMVVEELRAAWPTFLSFVLSFLTILIIWMNHHALFDWVVKATGQLMVANGFLLFLVVLVPFTTALLGDHLGGPRDAASLVTAVYTALLIAVSLAFAWIWRVVTRDRALVAPRLPDDEVRITYRYLAFGLLAQSAAFALAWWHAAASVVLTLVLSMFWLGNAYRRHRVKATEAAA